MHFFTFTENVEIIFEQTAYSIFENQQVVTVTLGLSDAYHEDIVVDVTVDELQGRVCNITPASNGGER